MNKYLYIGNDLIAGPVKMDKPLDYFGDVSEKDLYNYYERKSIYDCHTASLPKIEVNGTHSWEINQILVEGVDFQLHQISKGVDYKNMELKEGWSIKTVAVPIKLKNK